MKPTDHQHPTPAVSLKLVVKLKEVHSEMRIQMRIQSNIENPQTHTVYGL